MKKTTWLLSHGSAKIPNNAVVGGHDSDGSLIYVGRAYHEGGNLPGKVVPSKCCAYVAWYGKEHRKNNYEVLVDGSYDWQQSYGGKVPPQAVAAGRTVGGEILYVGRAHHGPSLCVGKIHPSHGSLYIPFGGKEIRINNYEVLCFKI